MAGLHFDITGDNSNFIRKLHECENGVKNTSKQIEQSGLSIEDLFNRMTKAAAAFGAGFTAKELISNIVQVRGEFQQLEIAFETMLGSKVKAETLMSQLTQTAAKTPFDLQGIANGAKQLLAYGIEAEKVNDTLVRLGNIASGLSLNLNDLVWLYGTTMTQGRLFTQDLRQFMGRGIPLAEELAEQFGVTTDKVGELVTAGKIGFPEVQKAIEAMTNEGGKFYNLMEKQSSSLTGQISNLSDAWDMMLNEIGTKTQGIASAGIATTASLVENYDKVGKAIAAIAATYGTYKAALIAARLLENGTATARLAHIKIIQLQTAAQTALNIVTKANPYVLLATAVVGVASAMWALYDSTSAAERAQRRYNDERQKFLDHEEKRRRKVGELIRTIQNETETEYSKIDAYEKLGKYSPALVEAYSREQIATLELAKSQSVLNEERDKMNYQVIISNIGKAKNALQEYTKARQEVSLNPQSNNQVAMYTTRIEQAEADLKSWQNALSEYNRLKKQAEEDAKPVEVKLMEAESNHEQIKQEFLAAKMALEEAQEELKNTPFAVIPIDIQLRFNNAQSAFEKSNKTIANLKSSQAGTEKTYRQAYKEAEDVWKAKTKAVEDAKNKSESEYLKAVKEFEEAEKVYKSLGGITGSALTKEGNQAVKLQEQQRQLLELRVKNAKNYARRLEDIYLDSEQSRIDAMEEGSKKTLDQMELNHEKELLAIDREKEELIQAKINAAKAEFEAEENVKASKNPNYKKQTFDASSVSVDTSVFDAITNYTQTKQANEIAGYYKDILSKYQDYTAQRISIEKQYRKDEEILREKAYRSQNEAERQQYENALIVLAEQREKSLEEISRNEIEDSGIWQQLMGDIESLPTDALEKLLSDAEKLVKVSNLSATDMKSMMDTINNARQSLISRNPFKTLKEEYEKYQKALKNGDKQGAATYWANIEKATDSIKSNISTLGSSLADLGGVFSNEVSDGIQSAVSAINSGITAFEVFGKKGERSASDIISGISGVIGVVTTLVGGIASLFDNSKKDQERNLEYQRRQEGYWEAINYQTERYLKLLQQAAGTDYFSTSSAALKNLEDARKKAQKDIVSSVPAGDLNMIDAALKQWFETGERLPAFDSTNKRTSKEIIDFINSNGGYDLENKLISEDAIIAMKNNADIWSKLPSWMQEAIDKFVELNDQAEELESTLNENLFQTTSKSIEEAILNGLKEGKRGLSDFGEDFETIMRDALLQSFVIDQLRGKAQEFYKKYTDLADSDKDNKLDLTAAEIEDLRNDWNSIIQSATEESKRIDSIIGSSSSSSSSQDSTSRGFQTMSQDVGEELNGRFTALQISNEEIKNLMMSTVLGIGSIVAISTSNNAALNDILNQNVIANGYLEDIIKHTKSILEFGNKFDRMITIFNDKL